MKTIFMMTLLTLMPFLLFSQHIKNADFVSPMEDGYAAVKVQNQWTFINEQGFVQSIDA